MSFMAQQQLFSDLRVQLSPTTGPHFPHQSNKGDGFRMTANHAVMLWKQASVVTGQRTPEATSSCVVRACNHTASGPVGEVQDEDTD